MTFLWLSFPNVPDQTLTIHSESKCFINFYLQIIWKQHAITVYIVLTGLAKKEKKLTGELLQRWLRE